MAPAKPPEQGHAPSSSPPLTTSPTDLISSIPGPVIRVLVLFSRPIRSTRIAIEVLLWKPGRRVESWMVVGGWWGVCLGAAHGFKYLLPIAVFLPLLPIDILRLPHVGGIPGLKTKPLPPSTASEPSTHDSLLMTISDLHAIHALIPPSPIERVVDVYQRFKHLGPSRLSRGLVVIWATWLILGRIVGYRPLLALLGTVLLLLPSPTFAKFVSLLSESLLVRRGLTLLFLFTFGSPPEQSIKLDLHFSLRSWVRGKWAASRRPSLALDFKPSVASSGKVEEDAVLDEEEESAGEPIYFKFEVHENQRWWMGLDWTSALVPQERPSWCDSHLLPASPPGAFTLPAPSSIILPAPTPTDPNAKVRRTATWRWLDDDWSIVRAGAGAGIAVSNTTLPSSSSSNALASPKLGAVDGEHAHSGTVSSPTKPRPTSGIFGTSPSSDDTLSPTSTGARAQSIAEQAFTKGLERLKRSTAGATGPAGATSSSRGSLDIQRPGTSSSVGGGGGKRRESQASEDLATLESERPSSAPLTGSNSGLAVSMIGGGETIVEKDDATDTEGWVYGDNKWESMGPKGGLGKFTRRRRWQRRAICIETIQRISDPSTSASSSVLKPSSPLTSTTTSNVEAAKTVASTTEDSITPKASTQPPLPIVSTDTVPVVATTTRNAHSVSPSRSRHAEPVTATGPIVAAIAEERGRESHKEPISTIPPTRTEQSRDDVLRQRLKKAMGNVGG